MRDWPWLLNYHDLPMIFGTETELGITLGKLVDSAPGERIRVYHPEEVFPAMVAAIGMKTNAFTRDPRVPWMRDGLNHLSPESIKEITEAAIAGDSGRLSEAFQKLGPLGLSAKDFYLAQVGIYLRNASRLYIDGWHLESSIGECGSPYDVVCQEKAMEMIIASILPEISGLVGREIRIFKDNTDRKGNSYSCHENFLLTREFYEELYKEESPWSKAWVGFLITSIIYTGAGKVGHELNTEPCDYQISQRADHFSRLIGQDTMANRPLINRRDESLTDSEKWGRFHVILSDSSMSEYSSFLKVGTKALVLNMLQHEFLNGRCEDEFKSLAVPYPVEAIKDISRDLTCRRPLTFGKENSSPLAFQKKWHYAASRFYENSHHYHAAWIKEVLEKWGETLDWLQADDSKLDRTLDWRIKRRLIENYREKRRENGEEIGYSDKRVKAIDVGYHDIGPGGFYNRLAKAGEVEKIASESDIVKAQDNPPENTRAYTRGQFVRHWREHLLDVQWEHVAFNLKVGDFESMVKVDLNPLIGHRHWWMRDVAGGRGDFESFCRRFLEAYLKDRDIF